MRSVLLLFRRRQTSATTMVFSLMEAAERRFDQPVADQSNNNSTIGAAVPVSRAFEQMHVLRP